MLGGSSGFRIAEPLRGETAGLHKEILSPCDNLQRVKGVDGEVSERRIHRKDGRLRYRCDACVRSGGDSGREADATSRF